MAFSEFTEFNESSQSPKLEWVTRNTLGSKENVLSTTITGNVTK